ncbi:MAG: hypothetical protein ACLSFZ_10995 [Frisingicoccus sp.]
MLLSVHVKNLALIDEVEMNFENHLNILTVRLVRVNPSLWVR